MNNPFIVAEMSANHLGSLTRALDIVEAAADAGADAVKLQTWTPGTMVGNPDLVIQSGPWAGRKMAELYEEAFLPWEWHRPIFDRAAERSIECFSTAFDLEALAFLESLGVKRHKIASFELVDLELIHYAAQTGKPLILSTGMATFGDLFNAVSTVRKVEGPSSCALIVLHCVSAYPAPAKDISLARMLALEKTCHTKVGLSDHTLHDGVAAAACAMGAVYVEKHLTLARGDGGPDAGFSLEPHEFKKMVERCREAAQWWGSDEYAPRPSEQSQLPLRRSLWWAKDVQAGATVSREMLRSARPADGLSCWRLPDLLDSTLRRAVKAGTPVREGDI